MTQESNFSLQFASPILVPHFNVCHTFQAQVQVARSLGRAVPLSPQLIFTPAATVTAVQSDSSTQASSQVILLERMLSLIIQDVFSLALTSFPAPSHKYNFIYFTHM